MPATIRVMVVDDHEVVRAGLRSLLDAADGIEVVGESASARDALATALQLRPDVAVVDMRMPGGDGPQLVREIRSRCPDTVCLMFTSFADEDAFFHAVMAGAAGYLLKDAENHEVVAAVRQVSAGGEMIPAQVIDDLRARRDELPPDDVLLADLTPQEQAIVRLIVKGHTNREIASQLYLAEKTVRNYVSNVLSKLGMKNRTEVAVYVAGLRGKQHAQAQTPDRGDLVGSRAASMRAHPSARLTA